MIIENWRLKIIFFFMFTSLYVLVFFFFGSFIGSFLNVVIYRTYYNKPFARGRSYCPKCKKQIRWYDNIPILSFLILKGKCRDCGKKISVQYPIVEFAAGLLFALSFYYVIPANYVIPAKAGIHAVNNFQSIFPATLLDLLKAGSRQGGDNFQSIPNSQFPIPLLLRDLFVASVLLVIFVQDFKWYIVLDKIVLPALVVVFALNLFLGAGIYNLLIAVLIGAGFFYLQFIVSQGRWIGGGDIRIGAFMGASLGYPLILVAIFLAYLIGSFFAIFLLLIGKKKMGSKLPLGTFLAPATLVVLLWGHGILSWYLNLFIG